MEFNTGTAKMFTMNDMWIFLRLSIKAHEELIKFREKFSHGHIHDYFFNEFNMKSNETSVIYFMVYNTNCDYVGAQGGYPEIYEYIIQVLNYLDELGLNDSYRFWVKNQILIEGTSEKRGSYKDPNPLSIEHRTVVEIK